MANNITVEQTAQMLLDNDNILLMCHKSPDGDTLGSAAALCYGLKQAGKSCAVVCADKIPAKYDYLNLPVYAGEFDIKFKVAVDVASLPLLGDIPAQYKENIELCIDHHGSNQRYSENICLKGDYPAAAQLVYEILLAMGTKITKDIANALYTGIITDTGCFMYSSTSAYTHIVAAQLMEKGAEHTKLNEKFFMEKSAKTVELEKFALNNYEYYFGGKCVILSLSAEDLQRINPEPTDLDGLVSMARGFEGVECSVMFKQTEENTFKCSVRTGESMDASKIAAAFGGGGHVRAAGCVINGNLSDIKSDMLKEIGKQCQ